MIVWKECREEVERRWRPKIDKIRLSSLRLKTFSASFQRDRPHSQDKKMFDQILGFGGKRRPLAVGKFVSPFLNAGEEHVLAIPTRFPALPTANGTAVAIKWRIPDGGKRKFEKDVG